MQGYPIDGLDEIVGRPIRERWRSCRRTGSRVRMSLSALDIMHTANERGEVAPPEAFTQFTARCSRRRARRRSTVQARACCARRRSAPPITSSPCRIVYASIAQMDAVFDQVDVLVMPTVQIVAPTMDGISPGFVKRNVQALMDTSIWNFDVYAISLADQVRQHCAVGLIRWSSRPATATTADCWRLRLRSALGRRE